MTLLRLILCTHCVDGPERSAVPGLARYRLMQDPHSRGTLCRVGEPPVPSAGDAQFTPRLRLEPVGPANAADLWRVHNDDEVSRWYDEGKPSRKQAEQWAEFMADSWRCHGVHKWIAYDRVSGDLVGRGGLSRTPVDDDWGQIYAFLPAEPWVRIPHESQRPFIAHANWLEQDDAPFAVRVLLRRDWRRSATPGGE